MLRKLQQICVPKPRCRSPHRQASIERRRVVSSYGMAPDAIRAKFTTGEMAALTVMAFDVQAHGKCDDCIDAIAAKAGVRRTTVQNAFRFAEGNGLIKVRRRPARIRGQKSDTNVVTIINGEWLEWLRKRRRPLPGMSTLAAGVSQSALGVGSKTTETKKMNTTNTEAKKEAWRGRERPKQVHICKGTTEWQAWELHLGRSIPVDKFDGWYFPSPMPPNHEREPEKDGNAGRKHEISDAGCDLKPMHRDSA